uniref:Uracil-DNA glycosylase n=1 Tax=Panagrolaimus davidi TaxID=227884 RepID=A0A914PA77_9BILA
MQKSLDSFVKRVPLAKAVKRSKSSSSEYEDSSENDKSTPGYLLRLELLKTITDETWHGFCEREFKKPYCKNIFEKLSKVYKNGDTVYPPKENIFRAFSTPSFDDIKVVLIGQDPYHNVGQANGFCFAVNEHIAPPPSLKNIFGLLRKTTRADNSITGKERTLEDWAEQGVFLLNTILTVDGNKKALSHRVFGWEKFTDAALKFLGKKRKDIVWLLMGRLAQSKKQYAIEQNCVNVPHPSPFSAHLFFQTRPFEEVNEKLVALGMEPIQWIKNI